MGAAAGRYFPPPHGEVWETSAPPAAGSFPPSLPALIAFAQAHESDFARWPDYPAKKAATLRDRLGPGAATSVAAPFAEAVGLSGLVVRWGRIVEEFGDTTHADEIASASKSFLSAVAGYACDRELITDLHRSVYEVTGLTLLTARSPGTTCSSRQASGMASSSASDLVVIGERQEAWQPAHQAVSSSTTTCA